jgi:hypothetical protein
VEEDWGIVTAAYIGQVLGDVTENHSHIHIHDYSGYSCSFIEEVEGGWGDIRGYCNCLKILGWEE